MTIDYIAEIAKSPLPFNPVEVPWAKRIFDIIASLILAIIFSPLIIFTVIIFYTEKIFFPSSRGPLFYSETRISKGMPFKLYKFRIFKAAATRQYFKEHGFIQTKALEGSANNLTYTGRLLKQIYMDELPQLYNVLKGEMTLVGPRPSNEVVTWEDGQAGRYQRYLFKGGLTGPFQAQKDGKNPPEQQQVDMDYVIFCRDNPGWKIVLNDATILLQTVLTVFRAKGV